LLRFIAQKESKCLELRSQLAVHEAELLQLKRKWERIVNKGHDRAVSINGTSASPSHTSSVSSGQVLGGIKEGVERLLAAGLGELASTGIQPVASTVTGMTHSTRQSISSVGTSSSTSTRYSQSSTNSSVLEDDICLESPREQELEGQVLIVETAEPTPTASPNSAIEIGKLMEVSNIEQDKTTAKARRRRSRDPLSSLEGNPATVPESNRNMKVSMATLSSIPSLGSLPPGTPSWVIGTMGKKWEEIQQSETFAKNQKRASLLISDMSQSLMNVWSLPMGSSVPPMSNLSAVSHPSQPQMSRKSPSTSSLLDDDGDSHEVLGEVLTPDSRSRAPALYTKSTTPDISRKQVQDEDDEWNW